jgi:hypothetical protein
MYFTELTPTAGKPERYILKFFCLQKLHLANFCPLPKRAQVLFLYRMMSVKSAMYVCSTSSLKNFCLETFFFLKYTKMYIMYIKS